MAQSLLLCLRFTMTSDMTHERFKRGRLALVVEDDAVIREMVAELLADEGYRVLTAAHGAAALDILRRDKPDVILLDMRMPVMDGWTFAKEYRKAMAPRVPIVVMTAALDALCWAQEIGADGVLPKPFAIEDLLAVVQRVTPGGDSETLPGVSRHQMTATDLHLRV
jgi:two-component system, chemotaxis family, chemotaxis protein CheY